MDGPAGACLRLLPKQAVVPTNETSDPIDDLGDVLTQLRALKGHLELEEVSKSSVGNLGGLIGNLGDIIHGMSQEPLSTVLGKMPRLVTTMAEECGKRARLETEGMSVRLDRSYVNSVRDILTHLIRNAVSHGIEDPVTRASLDKPIEGVITVRAEIVGTDLILKVEDDGAGIDGHSIRATAIEKGLIAVQDALSMAPAQLMDLMARPGFSTTRQTDRLSGRGVGLDQVQRILETKGGRIQVASLYGLGAAFIISIPLQESDRSQVSGGAL